MRGFYWRSGSGNGAIRQCNPQNPEPPRTRSITKAFSQKRFLGAPSCPWWLTTSQIAPLPLERLGPRVERNSCKILEASTVDRFRARLILLIDVLIVGIVFQSTILPNFQVEPQPSGWRHIPVRRSTWQKLQRLLTEKRLWIPRNRLHVPNAAKRLGSSNA
jgi:hypothetical protein